MKHIFYLVAIFFIIYEIMWIINPKKFIKSIITFDKLQKENKGKKWDNQSEEYKSALIGKIPHLFLFVWMFCGLLTFNWLAFLVKIIFGMLLIAPISKLLKFSKGYTALHWFNSVIGLFWGLFIVINSYHLKIDLLDFAKSLF